MEYIGLYLFISCIVQGVSIKANNYSHDRIFYNLTPKRIPRYSNNSYIFFPDDNKVVIIFKSYIICTCKEKKD